MCITTVSQLGPHDEVTDHDEGQSHFGRGLQCTLIVVSSLGDM